MKPIVFLSAHTDDCDEPATCRIAACEACDREVPACHISKGYAPGVGEVYACHKCSHSACEVCEVKA